MTPYIAIGVTLCLASLGVMWWLALNAERGWEDPETGYNTGEPPEHSDYDGDSA